MKKIILTILVLILFFVLFGVIVNLMEPTGAHTPGIIGIIVVAGTIAALRAIWKKNEEDNNNADGGTDDNTSTK